jgi:hypothetical protein
MKEGEVCVELEDVKMGDEESFVIWYGLRPVL